MKTLILWLAKTFDVCIERTVTKEVVKEVPVEVVKDRYLGGTVKGDVVVEGNLVVKGTLKVTGGLTIYKD